MTMQNNPLVFNVFTYVHDNAYNHKIRPPIMTGNQTSLTREPCESSAPKLPTAGRVLCIVLLEIGSVWSTYFSPPAVCQHGAYTSA
jgi:hypothetical protein